MRKGYDPFSLYLFDLIGMGTGGLRGRLEVDDEALLFYAGLLAQHPRSVSALEGLLRDYFGVGVQVVQFMGEWLPLSPENRSRLHAGDVNTALGVSTIAGNRVWDQQAKFRVRVGPLTYAGFCAFLPSGSAFRPLVELIRFSAGQEYDFDVQLILKAPEVPRCRLGDVGASAPRLGWSTWLKTAEFADDAEDAIFAPHVTTLKPQHAEASAEAGGDQDDRELEVHDWQAEPYLPQRA